MEHNLSTHTVISNDTKNLMPYPGQWFFLSTFSLTVLIIALITNSSVLFVFAKKSSTLCTPFNVYLINLLTANLLTMVIQVPNYLVNSLHGSWYTGSHTCNLYIFGFVFQAAMLNGHALITVNRLWAVLLPMHYRVHHTRRMAVAICVVMWVYVSLFKVAVLIPDALFYRRPEEVYGCALNRSVQLRLLAAHQIIVYNVPGALIVLAYPVICYRQWLLRRQRSSIGPRPLDRLTVNSANIRTDNQFSTENTITVGPADVRLKSLQQVTQPNGTQTRVKNGLPVRRARPHVRTQVFLLLTLVTITVVVVWLPCLVYYTVVLFKQISMPILEQGVLVMLYLEAVADPLLFTMALSDLRAEVKKLILRQ